MSVLRRILALFPIAAFVLGTASAYTYYTHYIGRQAPFVPIPERYDLTSLQNNTVYVFVSDAQPLQAAGDTYQGLVSEIQSAAKAWNDVGTSALRVGFGGLFTDGTQQTTPGIEVVFSDEIPPGLLGYTVNTTRTDLGLANGQFVPITQARVMLPRDLRSGVGPSYSEIFFQTTVHELGHALGLQHTLTSAAMSTYITSATSKAKPLAPDDMAGISALYPAQTFGQNTGTIRGTVTMGGSGVLLASVVAISPNGPAISGLTNPDGTYRIDGIPPGEYYVYVHPLPPAETGESTPANVVPPTDLVYGQQFPASSPFIVQFYPGTKNWTQATPVTVTAATSTDGVNFAVVPRGTPLQLYGVQTYNFPAQLAVKPPYLSSGTYRPFIVAAGVGLTPSVGVSLLNNSESIPSNPTAYQYAPQFVQINVQVTGFSNEGPRHMIFSKDNDLYLLPSAFNLVQRQPPSISSITPGVDASGNRIVQIAGTNLGADTRIWFDGVPATVTDGSGPLTVMPPPAAGIHANVVATNSDGQSSLFVQGNAVPGYDYDPTVASTLTVTPAALTAGAESMIEIDGVNTNFVDGFTRVGLGSSDVTVRRVWVLSPTKILANVAVSPNAPAVATELTVMTGLGLISQPYGFQILPENSRQVIVGALIPGPVYAGSSVTLSTSNLSAADLAAGVAILVNGQSALVTSVQPGAVTFQAPALAAGPAILQLRAGPDASLPIVLNIDPTPPSLVSVLDEATSAAVSSSNPAHPGDTLLLTVTQLASSIPNAAAVQINAGGIDLFAQQATPVTGQAGTWQVTVTLGTTVPTGTNVPLTVTAPDGRISQAVGISIASAQ